MDKIPIMLILRTLVILLGLQTAQSLEPKITCLALANASFPGDTSLLLANYTSVDNENQRGAVCGDGFTNNTARLLCKELGYDTARFRTKNVPSVDVVVSNVSCVSCKEGDCRNVTHWSNCTYSITSNPTCESGAVYLMCLNPKITRLALSPDSFPEDNSLLLANYTSVDNENRRGAVCGDGFTNKSARLLCKELGYGTASFRTKNVVDVRVVVSRVSCASCASCKEGDCRKVTHWSNCTYSITSNPTCESGAVYLRCGCPAGQFLRGAVCVDCHKNWYSTGGSSECRKCPDGTHSRKKGSDHCQSCDFGYQWKHKECQPCPDGSYGDGNVCRPCEAGYSTSGIDGLCKRIGPVREHWVRVLLGAAGGVLFSVIVAICALYANRNGDCCPSLFKSSVRYKHLNEIGELSSGQQTTSSRQTSLISEQDV